MRVLLEMKQQTIWQEQGLNHSQDLNQPLASQLELSKDLQFIGSVGLIKG
jgi:hypothetical protein